MGATAGSDEGRGRSGWAPPPKPTAKSTASARARQAQRDAEAATSRSAWARRHPALAAEERALRKGRADAAEQFGHKRHGTVETHAGAARTRQGALARLHLSGAIDDRQLDAGNQIAGVAERIGRDVGVRTASLETRVDTSRHGDAFWEALGAVRAEVAYGHWRDALGPRANLVLDVVVRDIGIAAAARANRMHVRRARALLDDALTSWWRYVADARREIDPATLAAAHAGLL